MLSALIGLVIYVVVAVLLLWMFFGNHGSCV